MLVCNAYGWEDEPRWALKIDGVECCPNCKTDADLEEIDNYFEDDYDFVPDEGGFGNWYGGYGEEDRSMFADPGGRSALRAGKREFPCPTCKAPNRLTAKDVSLGYQCDRCADMAEGCY